MKPFSPLLLAVCLTLFLPRTARPDDSRPGEAGAPTANVFVSSPQLPAAIRRVVILPLACEDAGANLADGCQMLDPVLRSALIKTGKFEVVAASPEALRRCTGRMSWTGAEVLPTDFFNTLKSVYGCDAVLFCELTVFRPSPPLAVGWRLKLVDAGTGKIIWAADSIFDAGNLSVARDAQQFQRHEQPHHNIFFYAYTFWSWCVDTQVRTALDDQWNILHSPQSFAGYSAQKLLGTLPQR